MKSNTRKVVYTGIFAAMVFVTTFFIKVPVASGYVHFGDAVIYLGAGIIGGPWAMLAGAVGAGLADLIGGYAIYAPASIIIKALVVVPFMFAYKNDDRLFSIKALLMSIPAGAITVAGYFLADMIIDKSYAIIDIPGNVVQAVGSAIVYGVLAFVLNKSNIKEKLFK